MKAGAEAQKWGQGEPKSNCKAGGALSIQVTILNDTFNLAVYEFNKRFG